MSPANVYRFFPSRRAIEEAVVAKLFERVFMAATHAARSASSSLARLAATLQVIAQLHEERLAKDGKLHDLVAVAARENWPVTLSHIDRIRGIVRSIIAAGQASSELQEGSPMALTCCLLEAMDAYINPSRFNAAALRPTFNEMMSFCSGALRHAPLAHSIGMPPDVRLRTEGQRWAPPARTARPEGRAGG
jgi:AcrR family transcriptional regulator